jgi:hypothetical protein
MTCRSLNSRETEQEEFSICTSDRCLRFGETYRLHHHLGSSYVSAGKGICYFETSDYFRYSQEVAVFDWVVCAEVWFMWFHWRPPTSPKNDSAVTVAEHWARRFGAQSWETCSGIVGGSSHRGQWTMSPWLIPNLITLGSKAVDYRVYHYNYHSVLRSHKRHLT